MKRTVYRIASAFLFLVILFYLIIVSGKLDFSDELWDSFYMTDRDSIDVALIGSSGIYRYYQQAQAYGEQGFTSYVLANARLAPYMATYLMDEMMRFQNPDMFVVEVRRIVSSISDNDKDKAPDIAFWATEDLLSSMDFFSPYRWKALFHNSKGLSLGMFIETAFPILNYHSNFYKDNNSISNIFSDNLWEKYFGSSTSVEVQDLTELWKDQSQLKIDGVSHLDEDGKRVIDEIAAKAEKYGKPLLFVITPYLKNDMQYSIQTEIADYMQEKGYDFLDCSPYAEEIGLDYSRDFYNTTHTNASGGHKFTSWFAGYLRENYDINSDHPENITAKWTKLAEDWDKLYAEKERMIENNLHHEDPETEKLLEK